MAEQCLGGDVKEVGGSCLPSFSQSLLAQDVSVFLYSMFFFTVLHISRFLCPICRLERNLKYCVGVTLPHKLLWGLPPLILNFLHLKMGKTRRTGSGKGLLTASGEER